MATAYLRRRRAGTVLRSHLMISALMLVATVVSQLTVAKPAGATRAQTAPLATSRANATAAGDGTGLPTPTATSLSNSTFPVATVASTRGTQPDVRGGVGTSYRLEGADSAVFPHGTSLTPGIVVSGTPTESASPTPAGGIEGGSIDGAPITSGPTPDALTGLTALSVANMTSGSGILASGSELNAGHSITSPDEQYRLSMQADGNLVVYNSVGTGVWETGTIPSGSYLAMQADGNLVVYNASGAPLWASNTAGNPGAYLVLGDDGELVVDSPSGEPLWAADAILVPGSHLNAGHSITSPDEQYRLSMQADGNLVVYNSVGTGVWETGTIPSGSYLAMQADGNLVVYNASGAPLWASNTAGNPGAYLVLGDDGELVVDSPSGEPLWAADAILVPGSHLNAGHSITSPDEQYRLSMQADGNLVVYNSVGTGVWETGTIASGSYLAMQADGNLVVYNASGAPLWASNTAGNPGAYLVLGDDGELVVDSPSGEPLWAADAILVPGSHLNAGHSITSPDEQYRLSMQADGNLVVYNSVGTGVWETGTIPSGSYLAMQADGNLVVYNASGAPLWASNTAGNPGAYLVLGDDGELVVDSPSGEPLWAADAILVPGSHLNAGHSITSPDEQYRLSMQADGNLVVYNSVGTGVWETGTIPSGSYLAMQADGNLVVYNASGAPLWASNTAGNPGAYLVLGDDGELVVDSPSGEPLWAADAILVPGPWTLAFDSEFNGASLDTSQWSTGWFGSGITAPVNSNEAECYDPAQVSVGNGELDLTAIARAETCGGVNRSYASGMVTTDGSFSFTYGYVEARIWLPGSGEIDDWPAFWTDGQSFPADGELDVMEGRNGVACAHFHNSAGATGTCVKGTFTGGWHTFAADWEPGSITFYYDGTEVYRDISGITSAPMYLILNLALDGQPANTVPATMRVDYVRVWQH